MASPIPEVPPVMRATLSVKPHLDSRLSPPVPERATIFAAFLRHRLSDALIRIEYSSEASQPLHLENGSRNRPQKGFHEPARPPPSTISAVPVTNDAAPHAKIKRRLCNFFRPTKSVPAAVCADSCEERSSVLPIAGPRCATCRIGVAGTDAVYAKLFCGP